MRVLLVVMLLLVGGCRKSSDKTTVETPEGTVTTEGGKVTVQTGKARATVETSGGKTVVKATENGKEVTYTAGETKVPEGFPLPVMNGARIEHSTHIKQADAPEVYQVSFKIASAPNQVADFYEKALDGKGLKVGRTDTKGDESTNCAVSGRSDNVETNVVAIKEAKSPETMVAIYWSVHK